MLLGSLSSAVYSRHSLTDSVPTSISSWVTYALRPKHSLDGWPLSSIEPLTLTLDGLRPARVSSRVVLPQPDGPCRQAVMSAQG
eukprot:366229-Chlamydomonas_euryale.AAC.25